MTLPSTNSILRARHPIPRGLAFGVLLALLALASIASADTVLLPAGATWKYLDNGTDQSAAGWQQPAFDDGTWSSGPAQLGYGEGDEATVVEDNATPGYNAADTVRYITTYFRKTFTVANPADFIAIGVRLLRDDGAVVYLNGTELRRDNLPAGPVTAATLASVGVSGVEETAFNETFHGTNLLVAGTNVIAVEIHQQAANSSDISFDLAFTGITSPDSVLLPAGATWRYLDNGTDQSAAGWQQPAFDDGAWSSGPAQLGYGEGDEATRVEDNATPGYNAADTVRYITTYFRKTFTVADPAAFIAVGVRLLRDDGAVVYLNGTELRRDNLPAGPVTAATLAPFGVSGADEDAFSETFHDPSLLVAGTNVIAVELHQEAPDSSDISFDLAFTGVTEPRVTRGPYLQKATPETVTVRWRTNVASNSRVSFGTTAGSLTQSADRAALTTEHEVTLTGLAPNTQFFYEVGSTTAVIAGGLDFTFTTPPAAGTSKPTRIWVIGDSGTGGDGTNRAEQVRDSFLAFAGAQHTDVWLMLGDNAYNAGLDSEYQHAVFDTYPSILRKTLLWSTIGNHETDQSQSQTLNFPYLDIFTLPANGEGGGVPSGTEKYYSFNYGDVHFICLDAMTSSRSTTGAMAQWLRTDLEAATQKWLIAFWHHPPYTKGSHNSDTESQLIQMRERFVPILEAGGVDLVLSGHSHVYERSKLINGHYGLSTTLTSAMVLDAGSGQESGTGAYRKPVLAGSGNQGAVYVVAGSSGKVGSSWVGGSTATVNPNPHPVMFASLRQLGSVVLDINGDRLDAKFLRTTGAIADTFTLLKDIPNVPPSVTITSPQNGAQLYLNSSVPVSADATDTGGTVGQVDFYANATLIGSDTTAPFSVAWSAAPVGQYALTAAATDNLGATTVSAPVNVSVVVRSFASWQAAHFTAAEITAGLADAIFDADFDGLLNLAEYALDTDPRANTPPLISALDATGHLTLTFTRPKALPNITYRGEVSGDLASWLSLDTPELLIDGDPQTLLFRDPVGTDASAQRFIRLRINSSAP